MAEESCRTGLKIGRIFHRGARQLSLKVIRIAFLNCILYRRRWLEALSSIGLGAGDSCAVLLRNHIDGVVVIHALFHLGVKIVSAE